MRKPQQRYLQPICLASLLVSGSALSADHNCADCHGSASPNTNDPIQALSGLRADCHIERIAAGEYVVDIPVNISSNTLPLQNGQLTCITCHDPHKVFAELLLGGPGLCRECHAR